MAKVVEGNAIDALFNSELALLAHCANTKNRMGAGFAKELKQRFPIAYEADRQAYKGLYNELGTVSYASDDDSNFFVANMYAQENYGKYGDFYLKHGRQVSYGALSECLRSVVEMYIDLDRYWLPIGFPYGMCCGHAGGDWGIVTDMVEFIVEKNPLINIPVVYYKL